MPKRRVPVLSEVVRIKKKVPGVVQPSRGSREIRFDDMGALVYYLKCIP